MEDYNSFIVPNWHLNNILKMRRYTYINKYYLSNGTFPSEEEISNIVISEDEKEKIKEHYYMLYLAEEVTKNNSSTTPPQENV
jgi:hypothetical protein